MCWEQLRDAFGSAYGFYPIETQQFPLFSGGLEWTDDTALCSGDTHSSGGHQGPQAAPDAFFLARAGSALAEIRDALEQRVGYDLHHSYEAIQPGCFFDESWQRSVADARYGGMPGLSPRRPVHV